MQDWFALAKNLTIVSDSDKQDKNMDYVIETFSLSKVFSDWWGRNKVYAVEDLELKIRENEVFGLLGPNGSGKTTTIKMILGLLHPTKGAVQVLGGNSADPKISSRIGFLPEESYLYKYLNARETLDFYGRLFGLASKVRKARTEALLEMVGLQAVANRAVGTFSKGMARRIGLAQALINDPELLILDEPTTGLDPIGTRQIKNLIIELAKRGKTILLCSHLLADVEDVCDRISILYGGKVRKEGKVEDLLQCSDKRQITTSVISDATIEKIRKLVESENAEFSVSSPMDKLENFFIRTVSQAQKDFETTSGAVSTTEIGDFLKDTSGKVLLDELVSGEKKKTEPASKTEVVSKTETVTPGPDKQYLDFLAHPSADVETKAVEQKQQKEEPLPIVERVNKNILDDLTRGDSAEAPETGKQGEPSDA